MPPAATAHCWIRWQSSSKWLLLEPGQPRYGFPLTLESKGQRDALKALTHWEEQNKTHIPWLAAHTALNRRQKNNNKNRQENLYISYLQNIDWVLQFRFSNFRWFSELSPCNFPHFLRIICRFFQILTLNSSCHIVMIPSTYSPLVWQSAFPLRITLPKYLYTAITFHAHLWLSKLYIHDLANFIYLVLFCSSQKAKTN